MRYLLDTNICIYLIKKRSERIARELERQTVGDVGISTITLAELYHGAARSESRDRAYAALEQFLIPVVIAPFDAAAAKTYGEIRASLQRAGSLIGPLDMLIAAHALSINVAVVTNNEREFRRVPRLTVVNWVRP